MHHLPTSTCAPFPESKNQYSILPNIDEIPSVESLPFKQLTVLPLTTAQAKATTVTGSRTTKNDNEHTEVGLNPATWPAKCLASKSSQLKATDKKQLPYCYPLIWHSLWSRGTPSGPAAGTQMQQGGTEPYSSEKASLQDCKVPADMGDTRRSRRASTKTEGKPPTELMVQGKDRADTGRTPSWTTGSGEVQSGLRTEGQGETATSSVIPERPFTDEGDTPIPNQLPPRHSVAKLVRQEPLDVQWPWLLNLSRRTGRKPLAPRQ